MNQKHLITIKRGNVENITVVILACENGHQIKSYDPIYTLTTSNGKMLIENQVDLLQQIFPKADLLVVTGLESDRITTNLPYNVRIVENQLCHSTGVAENLRLAINTSVRERLLIISESVIFTKELLLDLDFTKTFSVCYSDVKMKSHDLGLTIDNNLITQFSFGLHNRWCNIDFIQNEEFDLIKKICGNRNKNKLFMFEILNLIINNGGSISPHFPEKSSHVQKINFARELYENSDI